MKVMLHTRCGCTREFEQEEIGARYIVVPMWRKWYQGSCETERFEPVPIRRFAFRNHVRADNLFDDDVYHYEEVE